MGPTASGKSALALALAERFPVEIVSVDSAQVYRGMDIGTAKPDRGDARRVPHHLIDLIEPTDAYSAARFCTEATDAVAAIRARGRLPLLVGGTMLYFKALLEGLSALPQAQRALEVHALTGSPLSALQGAAAPAGGDAILALALVPGDRARLHADIAARFDAMLAAGLVDELRALRAAHRLDPALPAMRCVGYRQAWQYLDGAIDRAALRATGIAATRQLAKRQFTWLRALPAPAFDPWTAGRSRPPWSSADAGRRRGAAGLTRRRPGRHGRGPGGPGRAIIRCFHRPHRRQRTHGRPHTLRQALG
ncbi:MAG: tRNA dimethylallyltransferase [Betaproteobacteria bacterium]|nr:tRNA dimethylallyltransferase [Betaproteobacteria bacterium]